MLDRANELLLKYPEHKDIIQDLMKIKEMKC